jgi:hypothetical protein
MDIENRRSWKAVKIQAIFKLRLGKNTVTSSLGTDILKA